jgi:hypothetical protein
MADICISLLAVVSLPFALAFWSDGLVVGADRCGGWKFCPDNWKTTPLQFPKEDSEEGSDG